MSEWRDEYNVERREMLGSPDELGRDELIHWKDSECDSQQELIERLADDVLSFRARMLRSQEEMERAKHNELVCLRWLQEKDAWAKAWREAAKHNRRTWLLGIPIPANWRKRQRSVVLGSK